MPEIRITFEHLALVINEPTRAVIVLPHDNHNAVLDIPGVVAGKSLPKGTDIRLLDPDGQPLVGPTGRPSNDRVVHLDDVFGHSVKPDPALTGDVVPTTIGARVILNQGHLVGCKLQRYGTLSEEIWQFTSRIGRPDEHVHLEQKISDTVRYIVDVSAGAYRLRVGTAEYTVNVADQNIDIRLTNDDGCEGHLAGPRYVLREYKQIYGLTDQGAIPEDDQPIPVGTFPAFDLAADKITLDAAYSCDLVCGNAQCG